ncbi:RNA exonuclease 4 [Candida viswanathii]|uniref:RNA exonuclease 4 n=1 Tax=Candida viswanathii TaxID=5486 RepID=A0A367YDU1_9ASCO|nr:RNA exonuclease 4 [Candida viswanathii]
MAKLSSNWKKLSTKLQKDTKKGSVQKPKPKLKPKKQPSKPAVRQIGYLAVASTAPTTTTTVTPLPKPSLATPLEYALWTQSEPIDIQAIPKSPKPLPQSTTSTSYDSRKSDPGRYIALDCEFVGLGPDGAESALARISIVNYFGVVLFDSYVRPQGKVTDFRTWVSGVESFHLRDAIEFRRAQEITGELLQGKVLVGHAIKNDLDMLYLGHPKSMIRDTSKFKKFRAVAGGKAPGLKKLAKEFLDVDIQVGQHSSVEDARATMLLFRLFRKEIESASKK